MLSTLRAPPVCTPPSSGAAPSNLISPEARSTQQDCHLLRAKFHYVMAAESGVAAIAVAAALVAFFVSTPAPAWPLSSPCFAVSARPHHRGGRTCTSRRCGTQRLYRRTRKACTCPLRARPSPGYVPRPLRKSRCLLSPRIAALCHPPATPQVEPLEALEDEPMVLQVARRALTEPLHASRDSGASAHRARTNGKTGKLSPTCTQPLSRRRRKACTAPARGPLTQHSLSSTRQKATARRAAATSSQPVNADLRIRAWSPHRQKSPLRSMDPRRPVSALATARLLLAQLPLGLQPAQTRHDGSAGTFATM